MQKVNSEISSSQHSIQPSGFPAGHPSGTLQAEHCGGELPCELEGSKAGTKSCSHLSPEGISLADYLFSGEKVF